jgi:hypothetical protein
MKKQLRATTDEHWCCVDCGKNTFQTDDYYMVTHELWQKYGVGEGMLCVGCIEKRIGHKLTREDLLNCPLNTDINPAMMKIWHGK